MVALQAAGQTYVIDRICLGSIRNYRVEGEAGSTYSWFLVNSSGALVPLGNSSGIPFTKTNPDGTTSYGNEVSIDWKQPGAYRLQVIQNSVLGCDTLEQGIVEVFEQPVAKAGVPLSICSDTKVELSNSFASDYSSLLWTSSGDGTFDDPLALRTAYNPGPNDLIKGDVKLTLTAQGMSSSTTCHLASSTLLATFMIAPKLIVHDPPEVCLPQPIDLSAALVTAGSDPGLTFEYFVDSMATINLSNYKAVDKGGIYYIRATSSITGCKVMMPVKVTFTKQIVPNFASIPEVCLNSANPPILQSSSFNGITGSWNPSVIATNAIGKTPYKFTLQTRGNAQKIRPLL